MADQKKQARADEANKNQQTGNIEREAGTPSMHDPSSLADDQVTNKCVTTGGHPPVLAEFENPADMPNFAENDFSFLQLDKEIRDVRFEGKPIGFFKDAMIRFVHNKAAVVSFIIIAFLVVMAIIGPSMNKWAYDQQNIDAQHLPPRVPGLQWMKVFSGTNTIKVRQSSIEGKYKDSYVETLSTYEVRKTPMAVIRIDAYKQAGIDDNFWFGTDYLGRDLWTRLWRGTRVSFLIAIIAMVVNIVVGIIYGSVSGFYGGWVDILMQRIAEIIGGIPLMVVLILFVIYLGPGIIPIALALCLTGWMGTAQMIRAQFLKYREMEYVLASKTLGASDMTLIFRHILPNAVGVIITMSALQIPGAIFEESFLAYLGLGIKAPEPSIGVLLAEGQKTLLLYPTETLFPAIVISILMITFNMMGNGLRDAFDPTLRGIE